ncbi:MAG TPA: ABC transporter permease [Vicinamibacterales bacterium]|nr:ABC transporter permease [Vicinamibacterales bacterium]
MTILREWLARLLATVRANRKDADLEEELRLHLELAAEHAQPNGPSPDDARRAARLRLGAVTQAMDALRDQRGLPWLEDLAQDVRYGLRTLRRSPIFAVVVVVSLGLGIGANSALFSLIDATLLRKLPVENPDELVQLRWKAPGDWLPERDRFAGSAAFGAYGRRSPTFSNAAFEALRDRAETLSEIFAFSRILPVNATIDHQADRSTVQLVSPDYFAGLRLRPAIGRILTSDDDQPSSEPAAVISHRFWQRRFDRNPNAMGTSAALDGLRLTIVGVAPEGFRGVASAGAPGPDFWIPLAFGSRFGSRNPEPGFWWLSIMGRLRPGVTIDQVRDNLAGTFRAAVHETESTPPHDQPQLDVWPARRGAREEGPEDELEHAIVLGGIFGILLLVVCLNVANLLLSRAAARRAEIAVRLALGAGRERLVRQLLAESVTLAVAGGILGLALAHWGKELFSASALVPPDMDLRIDAAVMAATLGLSAFAGVVFGLVPALRSTRNAKAGAIEKLDVRTGSGSRLNRSLIVAQVALSVVLLVAAGLFVRTLGAWSTTDPGFDADNLLIYQVSPGSLGYDDARAAVLRDRLAARVRTIPGVAGITTSGPFWEDRWFGGFLIDGERRRPIPHWLPVRHDFFQTLRVPVLAGRGFMPEENDKAGPPAAMVVDEEFARLFFANSSPIGRRIAFRRGGAEVEIVGVVGKIRLPGTLPEDIRPRIYLPEHTRPSDFDPDWTKRSAAYRLTYDTSFLIRTASDPIPFLPAIRGAIREVEPDLAVLDPTTLAQRTRERLSPTRVASVIWASFGSVTLILTAVGLYGLLAYSVVQRTREIGIRTALGARRADIIRLVTGQTFVLVTLGIVIGIGLSLGASQLTRAFIFGVSVYDPLTLVAVVLIIALVTGLAALLPARRAARVDPTVALRCQ